MLKNKGVSLSRPIVFGTVATPIAKDVVPNDPSHTHNWTIYLRGQNGEDISYFIKKIGFKLHDTYSNSNRIVESPPYEVTETGWGEFEIVIKIWFVDPSEKPVTLYHQLQLYHKDEVIGQPFKKPVVFEHYEEIVNSSFNHTLNQLGI